MEDGQITRLLNSLPSKNLKQTTFRIGQRPELDNWTYGQQETHFSNHLNNPLTITMDSHAEQAVLSHQTMARWYKRDWIKEHLECQVVHLNHHQTNNSMKRPQRYYPPGKHPNLTPSQKLQLSRALKSNWLAAALGIWRCLQDKFTLQITCTMSKGQSC